MNKERLEKEYASGKSMTEVSKIFNCSTHKVSYWMNKYNIPRRNISEAIYQKANPTGDPYKIVDINSIYKSKLLGLGIGIYWGEGEKVSKHGIRVINGDFRVILIFRKFLREICTIKEEKISYSLICFNDSEIQKVATYWSNALGTSINKFGKIVQVPPQGKGRYRKKSEHGVCTISVSNIKLKAWILDQINNA